MKTMRRLGGVASFIRGITFKPNDVGSPDEEGMVACLRTKNVQETLQLDDVWGVPKAFVKRDEQYLRTNDVLMSTANSWNLVGKCCLVDNLSGPTTLGGFISAVRIDPSKADPKYIYYWLAWSETQKNLQACGKRTTNISNLDLGRSLDLPLYQPPLAEQRRIAAILDQADALRTKRRLAISKLSVLLHCIFIELFDRERHWKSFTIRDLGEVQGGLQVTPRRDSCTLKRPYLRVANVYRDHLDLREIKQIGLTGTEYERVRLNAGDILVVEGHGNPNEIGRSAVWEGAISDCVHQNHLIRIRLDQQRSLPVFISTFLNSSIGRHQLIAAANTTSGLNTISVSTVKSVKVPVPPVSLQFLIQSSTIRSALDVPGKG